MFQIFEALLMNTTSNFLDFDASRGEAMQGAFDNFLIAFDNMVIAMSRLSFAFL